MTDSEPDDDSESLPENGRLRPSAPRDGRTSLEIARVLLADPLPYLTADLPGIGGRLKVEPEDFVVDEIPAYEPSGEGQHLFLKVEKRDLAAEDLRRHLARKLRVDVAEIGMAGLKDRRAVTRQYVSVPAAAQERIAEAESPQVRILSAVRHGNKLKTGHLRGNRFDVLVRDTVPNAMLAATRIALDVSRRGFPNYYGTQRFGRDGTTLALGLDLLRRTRSVHSLPRAGRQFRIRLALSAVQSSLFNRAVAARLRAGKWDRVEAGEVLQVAATGGPFVCRDPEVDQARYDSREVVPSGPMFGPRMLPAEGAPGEREAALLAEGGFGAEHIAAWRKLMGGGRRLAVVWPQDLEIEADPLGVRFRFTLPSGSYATVLLREFCKTDEGDAAPEEDGPTDGDEA